MKRQAPSPNRANEYPKWLDKFGARKMDAKPGPYPPDASLEWHATMFQWSAWTNEPSDRFGRKYGVNIESFYWGLGCGCRTFDEAMRVINDFQLEYKIPSRNYHLHLQYRPEKVRREALQMPLFPSYELEN